MFGHERFEVYNISIEFNKAALELIDKFPPGFSSLKDQFRRAAFSITLNIAEGTGKHTQPDKKRFYAIARGSTMECAAICDIVCLIDGELTKRATEAKELLNSIAAILTVVCR